MRSSTQALSRGLVAIGIALASLAGSRAARADDCKPANKLSPCIDSDNLWMHPGGGPFLSIGTTTTTPNGQASFDVGMSWLSRPIGLRVASPDPAGSKVYAVDNVLDATLLFAFGLSDRFEFDVAAPFTLIQNGAGVGGITGADDPLPKSAVRDLRFGVAWAMIARSRVGDPDGLAIVPRLDFSLPTHSQDTFGGDRTMVAFPAVTVDERLFHRFTIAAELSARIRGQTTIANVTMASQLGAALGASYDVIPKNHWLTASAEAFLLSTLATQGAPARDRPADDEGPALVPAEWILSVTSAPFLGGDVSATFGGGASIPLATEPPLTSPRFRFDLALRYAPTGHDRDGDGVLDRDDKCPDVPEDRDGFEDKDGCPDLDNDKDGIPDAVDLCRDQPEDFDGFEDKDGCPDLDDDKDGIPDTEDKCRMQPEDKDGFEDKDGCPDPDNDKDGIPDVEDACPNVAGKPSKDPKQNGCPNQDNDHDGIPDEVDACPDIAGKPSSDPKQNGCPDVDTDHDGIPDDKDRCPTLPETIDGVQDDDGCPEPKSASRVKWSGDRVVLDKPHRFAPGSKAMTKDLEREAKMIAQLVRGRGARTTVLVEAYPDRPDDASDRAVVLAADRAAAVKSVLVANGIAADRITAAAAAPDPKRARDAAPVDVTVTAAAPARKRE